MTYSRLGIAIVIIALCIAAGSAQSKAAAASPQRASAAFAEVVLRRAELLSESEALAETYTDVNPKVVDLRYEVAALDKFLSKILGAQGNDIPKLTLALGKLMVRRASADTEVARLSRSLNADHPDYKRAKKRLEVFDAAIKEILP